MARPADLLSVEEARERILAGFRQLDAEGCPLEQSAGRVLAEQIQAQISLPPFDNSSMDGFALSSGVTAGASKENPVTLPVAFVIAAGAVAPGDLPSGSVARIMTGAPMPPGADAVVPFEEVEDTGGAITLRAPIRAAACLRRAGQDVRPGTAVLEAGTELGSAQIGLLAALGYGNVSVVRRPRVAIVSTGDELVAPGTPLRTGQIYNSNAPMLAAAVREAGGEPGPIRTVGDDPDSIAEVLREARGADLIVTSGGASVGDFDHVKAVLGAAGDVGFWRVRIRPGKPLIHGSMGGTPLIGLPGNPTSAMVTFEVFVRPGLRTMLGAAPARPEIDAVVDEKVENHGGRETFARVVLSYDSGQFHASLAGAQDSAMLLPLARADGLLRVPADVTELAPGDRARVIVLRVPD